MKTYSPGWTVMAAILLLGPLLIFITLRLVPAWDPSWANSVFHFYIVSFTSLIAFVVAIFVLSGIGAPGAPGVFPVPAVMASGGGSLFCLLCPPWVASRRSLASHR